MNDSLTLNLNELSNSNINFDNINIILNGKELKNEFTRPPEDNTFIKDEISKLMEKIKKLREEVNEFKFYNSELKKSNISHIQSNAQSNVQSKDSKKKYFI